jgi:hypothetical protein
MVLPEAAASDCNVCELLNDNVEMQEPEALDKPLMTWTRVCHGYTVGREFQHRTVLVTVLFKTCSITITHSILIIKIIKITITITM